MSARFLDERQSHHSFCGNECWATYAGCCCIPKLAHEALVDDANVPSPLHRSDRRSQALLIPAGRLNETGFLVTQQREPSMGHTGL